MKFKIFELDDLYQFGLVRFELDFHADEMFGRRKVRHVTDRRHGQGDDPWEDAGRPAPDRTPDSL